MAIIISVSIDKRQAEFIRDTKLSPSAVLQRSLNEMIQRCEVSPEYVKQLQQNMSLLQKTITKQGTFIDKHGLMQEYLNVEDV